MSNLQTLRVPDEARLSALLERIQTRLGIPGIAAAVSVEGCEVVSAVGTSAVGSHRPLAVDARFSIGCIMKLLVGAMCLELARGRHLDLDAPMAEYLPELRGTSRGRLQVLRHLLAHRSGFQEVSTESILAQRLDGFANAPQLFEPGSVFSYEHCAYVLVGEILRRVTGREIDSVLMSHFLETLAIVPGRVGRDPNNAIGHEFRDEGRYFVPADVPPFVSSGAITNMTLSIRDLARLARAFAVQFDPAWMDVNGNQSAAEGSLELQCALPRYVEGTRLLELPIAFGVGCAQYSQNTFGADGGYGGQMCSIRFDPVNKVGIAVAMNAEAIAVRNGVVKALMHDMRLVSTTQVPFTRQSYDFDLGNLTGEYVGANRGALNVIRTPAGFELDFDFGVPGERLRIDLQYKPQTNQLQAQGSSQHCALAIFQPPKDNVPCVSASLSAFRRK